MRFEEINQLVEEYTERISQAVWPLAKSEFLYHANALLISHIQHSIGLIAPRESGYFDGSC